MTSGSRLILSTLHLPLVGPPLVGHALPWGFIFPCLSRNCDRGVAGLLADSGAKSEVSRFASVFILYLISADVIHTCLVVSFLFLVYLPF